MPGTLVKLSRKCREDFSGRSTGNERGDYYKSKGHALTAFGEALEGYDLHLDFDAWVDYNGDEGRANHPICDESNNQVGCAIFSWYRTESGRYEFIGYMA